MSLYRGPELLAAHHIVAGFACGAEDCDAWIRRRAPGRLGSSRIWVMAHARVVAFCASGAAVVTARHQPDPLRAIRLSRLAVDRSHQHRGLAAALLRHCLRDAVKVAAPAGVRVVLVHAKDASAAGFYRRFGFEQSPLDDWTLMLPVKDIDVSTEEAAR